MNRKSMWTIVIATVWLAVIGGLVISAQDKYTVKVPGGLAFSEFRGYETWPVISFSRNERVAAVIVGNPVMMDAYRAGFPANGKPVPDGAKMAKIHWAPKPNEFFEETTVPGNLVNVDFMVKDSKWFAEAVGGDMRCSTTTRSPTHSNQARRRAHRRRGTTPSAVSPATRRRRREITCSRITGSAEFCASADSRF
jgi:hypothetical protein